MALNGGHEHMDLRDRDMDDVFVHPSDSGPLTIPDVRTSAGHTPKTLLDLGTNECRWPVGEATGIDQLFCASRAVKGKPYCQAHYQRSIR
ncbi:MAG: hypothetical protein GEU95_25990 [Rhizobiales bacterium]|nr:hypothetical protein [Hyphomicrobiales bacterium]